MQHPITATAAVASKGQHRRCQSPGNDLTLALGGVYTRVQLVLSGAFWLGECEWRQHPCLAWVDFSHNMFGYSHARSGHVIGISLDYFIFLPFLIPAPV